MLNIKWNTTMQLSRNIMNFLIEAYKQVLLFEDTKNMGDKIE